MDTKNSLIVNQLGRLIKQVKWDIVAAKSKSDVKDTERHKARLRVFMRLIGVIESLDYELKDADDLKGISGISGGSIRRVNEILRTGHLGELIRNDNEGGLIGTEKVIGIGPSMANMLRKKYGILTVDDLKKNMASGKVTVNDKISLGLKYYGVVETGIPRDETMLIEKELKRCATRIDKSIGLVMCGSYRRGKVMSNDIDVVMYHPSITTMDQITNPTSLDIMRTFVTELSKSGFLLDHITDKRFKTKYMGFAKQDGCPVRRIDMRLIPMGSVPTALLANTGPAELNEYMRSEAKRKGMLLNEYGLYRKDGDNLITVSIKTEKDVFDALDMAYLSPIDRESFSLSKIKKFSSN